MLPLRRLSRRAHAALVAVCIGALVLIALITSRTRDEPSLHTLVERVVEAGVPGALVVIHTNGDVQVESSGSADELGLVEMTADARFRVGSVTKSFVATLVLLLVEEGKLELDDTVDDWLPRLVPGGSRITVRQLLSHTSGLPDYVEDAGVVRNLERRWRPRELIAVATTPISDSTAPGRYAYASTNYLVLGLIVEAATGTPLGTLLRERIFDPLDLHDTAFAPGRVRGRYIHGHRPPSHQGVITGPPVDIGREPAWWIWSAGSIVSTANDLQHFFAALLDGRVLGPELLREMETATPAGHLRYGLGIAEFPTPCGPAWGHTGNVAGTIVVAWSRRDGTRQLVLVVNTFPLTAEQEEAVRALQDGAFCGA